MDKPVVDPARGKGDEERRQGEQGNDDADLPAVEADVQEVERDKKKQGGDRELAGEIDVMDLRVQRHSGSKTPYYNRYRGNDGILASYPVKDA